MTAAARPGWRVRTPSAPRKRTSVNIRRGDGTHILAWSAPADNGFTITRYDIEYRASSATTWTSSGTSTTASKTISSVTNATSYVVRVRAANANGNHARVRARNAGNLYGEWSDWLRLQ